MPKESLRKLLLSMNYKAVLQAWSEQHEKPDTVPQHMLAFEGKQAFFPPVHREGSRRGLGGASSKFRGDHTTKLIEAGGASGAWVSPGSDSNGTANGGTHPANEDDGQYMSFGGFMQLLIDTPTHKLQ